MPITDRLKIPLLRYNVSLHKNCRTKPFHGTSRRTEQKGDRIGQLYRAIDELSTLSRSGRPCVCRVAEPSALFAGCVHPSPPGRRKACRYGTNVAINGSYCVL